MKKLLNSELGRKNIESFKKAEKIPVIIVLDNIRSLNNIGSVFRTSDAFLVKAIYLCGITACPPHRDIQKTALGATDSVEWKYFEETKEAIKELKAAGYLAASLEQADGSVCLDEFSPDPTASYAFIFGHEVKGVDEDIVNISDICLEIPQFGTKHSFNISVSAGMVLWDYHLKTRKGGK